MKSVTAAELVRGFSKYRLESALEPVSISHHGQNTHVLCSLETFERLQICTMENRSCGDCDVSRFELAEWIEEGVIACDRTLQIAYANRSAYELTQSGQGGMQGQYLFSKFPQLENSVVEAQLRHTLTTGKSVKFDLPSTFMEGAWLRMKTFLFGPFVVLRMEDITDTYGRMLRSDVSSALASAIDHHADIASVVLSSRGTITEIGDAFCERLDFARDRLMSAPFSNLVVMADRVAFREAFEAALQNQPGRPGEVEIMTNSGRNIRAGYRITPLEGVYGNEGAVLLLALKGEVQQPGMARQKIGDQAA